VNSGNTLTISSNIINNAGANGLYGDGDDGIVSLSKADAGLLVLSGANTYSGTNFLNGGVVQITTENNLGALANDVTFGGGTLSVATGFHSRHNQALHDQRELKRDDRRCQRARPSHSAIRAMC
jgi:autotransporter-associated beta strand protein